MKVYFASSITQASEDLKPLIAELQNRLKQEFELFEFYGHKPGPALDMYLFNKVRIDSCDLVVAEVSQPSLGVGYEIGYALSQGKKVVAFALENIIISRMITGNPNPNLKFSRYKVPDDVINILKENPSRTQ